MSVHSEILKLNPLYYRCSYFTGWTFSDTRSPASVSPTHTAIRKLIRFQTFCFPLKKRMVYNKEISRLIRRSDKPHLGNHWWAATVLKQWFDKSQTKSLWQFCALISELRLFLFCHTPGNDVTWRAVYKVVQELYGLMQRMKSSVEFWWAATPWSSIGFMWEDLTGQSIHQVGLMYLA